MRVRNVQINENDDGWEVTYPDLKPFPGRLRNIYHTAFEALAAIKEEDLECMEGAVSVIEWTVKSRVGRLVVQVLTKT
jgi:hypothetical protein